MHIHCIFLFLIFYHLFIYRYISIYVYVYLFILELVMCNIKMLYCMCVRCFLVKPRPQAPIKHERYYKVHKSLPINNVLQLSFFFALYCYLWFIYYCTCPVHIFIFLYYFINSMYLLHIILYLFFYLFCNH